VGFQNWHQVIVSDDEAIMQVLCI